LFLDELERTRVRFGLRVYGYVLMPEHVHLLISEPDSGTLADAIRSLKLCVSKRAGSTAMKDGCSRLWQARYYDRNTRDYEEFREKLKYIHRNPVKRDLCDRPEGWKWSSFVHYATGAVGPVEIESDWTARRRERSSSGKLCTGPF
jgi:putative transposase